MVFCKDTNKLKLRRQKETREKKNRKETIKNKKGRKDPYVVT